jgi:DNA-binding NtrC family response regulator
VRPLSHRGQSSDGVTTGTFRKAQGPQELSRPAPSDSGKVLIIDDDPLVCRSLARWLKSDGFDVVTVTDVAMIDSCLREHEFEAVVTDLHLGDRSGLDVARSILATRPGVPLIVMTGDQSDSAVGAIRASAFDFLAKPFDLEVATTTVGRAVRSHREALAASA